MKKNKLRTILIMLLVLVMPVPVYADYGSIEIDGYYDDWEDKPHTEVYNGNNPPAGKINYVSLFRDESNAYVHIEYARINNQTIDNMRVDLYTNLGDERYELVPDYDFDIFDETDLNNMENMNPEVSPNDVNSENGSESGTDLNNTNDNNAQDNGNGSNDSNTDSNSTETNNTDNSTDSNNGDTNESQQSDQILAGNATVIITADQTTDQTTDQTSNNGQDKKDTTEQDSIGNQGNNNDSTDSNPNNNRGHNGHNGHYGHYGHYGFKCEHRPKQWK